MIFTVETYLKNDPDWVERHRTDNAEEAYRLASEFTEVPEYNGIRVVALFDNKVWRAVRLDYDYMAGRKLRAKES